MIVQSFGQLQAVRPSASFPTAPGYTPVTYWYDDADDEYAAIYADQPNIRICVDFIARNMAQLGLHAYRRKSDTDRERLTDHDTMRWLGTPNPSKTFYRLIEDLLGDMGVYFNAYWLKVRYKGKDGKAIGFVRLPPNEMTVLGGLLPSGFLWERGTKRIEFPPSEIVFFNGYNALNPLTGLSPIHTLAGLLREEAAATANRAAYWNNAARFEGVIERPREAPKWNPAQKQEWRRQWQERYAGAAAYTVPVLEDGMIFKPTAFSARDSQFTETGKLRREVCAAMYHIPQTMVGILEHATLNNVTDQHKQLYQDCLGPWCTMITKELARQVLVESTDQTDVYYEFNIAEKLKGSFEEQASALQMSVGRPLMTPNEGRARLNLPSIKDDPTADQLAPQQGGPSDATAQPQDGAAKDAPPAPAKPKVAAAPAKPARAEVASVLDVTRARQLARLARFPAAERSTVFFAEMDRYNRELATDLAPLVGAEATALAIQHNVSLFTELDR